MLASRATPRPAEYLIEHRPIAAASQANPKFLTRLISGEPRTQQRLLLLNGRALDAEQTKQTYGCLRLVRAQLNSLVGLG
jgi:hypothetical protein